MRIEGKISLVNVKLQTVYESLLKPEILRLCIPGTEQIEQVDEKTYDCVIKQSVGPMAMRFKARNTITSLTPPKQIALQGDGDILGASGKFFHNTVIELQDKNEHEVEVCYSSDVNITGTMAVLGNRVIKAKAKTLEEEISKALQEKLQNLG